MLYATITFLIGSILISSLILILLVLISKNAFLYFLKKSMKFDEKFVTFSKARLSQS